MKREQVDSISYTHFRTEKHSRIRIAIGILMAVSLALVMYIFYIMQSPKDFIPDTIITIEQGTTVNETAELLEEQNIIQSSLLFNILMRISDHQVIAGDYLFQKQDTLLGVVERVSLGDYGDVRIKVVLQEGGTVLQFAEVLAEKLPKFDKDEFLEEVATLEGYLYPDSYFFFPSVETIEVVDTLHQAFLDKISKYSDDILKSEHTLQDIVTMASIIEKEATTNATERAMISGILWKRIDKGMPLQVDAPFVYERDKGSLDLTIADLREDSEYNTYTNLGLTPTPIGNPSIGSIKAALYPQESPYLYFLHGNDRQVHYASTHDGHVTNKRNYLD